MSNITSYDSMRMTKFIFSFLLIIIFYFIHIYTDAKNRDEVENYIIEQMSITDVEEINKFRTEMKNKTSFDICNNDYINSNNYEEFKYCIAHKK